MKYSNPNIDRTATAAFVSTGAFAAPFAVVFVASRLLPTLGVCGGIDSPLNKRRGGLSLNLGQNPRNRVMGQRVDPFKVSAMLSFGR